MCSASSLFNKSLNKQIAFWGNLFVCLCFCSPLKAADPPKTKTIRVATYNIAMHRYSTGQLTEELSGQESKQAAGIAEVIQRVRPDILLLCEFDYEEDKAALKHLLTNYLEQGQGDQQPISYPHTFSAPSNTGEPSGIDMDQDGKSDGPADAYGYGYYPGQYGMAVLSRYPIAEDEVRSFRKFLWKDMPDAALPIDPDTGKPYYSESQLEVFRLSSKSHWDVPILVENDNGEIQKLHLLCSHPTPPVFDGPEDRNGCRNHDEIRLLADYIDPKRSQYLVDDNGVKGGLSNDEHFVIVGDLNADPVDGDSYNKAIMQLLDHPLVNQSPAPRSSGGKISQEMNPNFNQNASGNAEEDTADFSVYKAANLRADYVLPSHNIKVIDSGIFWPEPNQPGYEASTESDHRLVWVDIEWE